MGVHSRTMGPSHAAEEGKVAAKRFESRGSENGHMNDERTELKGSSLTPRITS